jgi:peptidoglycan hydrolase-like protein with peptidoglycan-binding domain
VPRPRRAGAVAALALLVALAVPAVAGARSASVAALQVALRAQGVYAGSVDGLVGPGTRAGVRAIQRRAGLAVDGIAGPRTRRALGRLGRHRYGRRVLRLGRTGWDVATLQFRLEMHGFPMGGVDGGFGYRTQAAVIRFQRSVGLYPDGVAGPATFRALSGPPRRAPYPMRRPVAGGVGDRFGPRGAGMHAGLDFPAPSGTPVAAAASGRVTRAGWNDGYGLTVVVYHGRGVRTRYAHLSSLAVGRGNRVRAGWLIGRVGTTGFSTGPHLHFEITVRGAAVDPAPALGF